MKAQVALGHPTSVDTGSIVLDVDRVQSEPEDQPGVLHVRAGARVLGVG